MSITRYLLTIFLCVTVPCSATMIVIHGSFAAKSEWHRPRGSFYEAVRSVTDQPLISFSWSGDYRPEHIIADTAYLVELLLSLDPHDPITILAHSNGGNLSFYATLVLKELLRYRTQQESGDGTIRSLHAVPPRLLDPFRTPRRAQGADAPDPSIHECLSNCFERLKKQISQKKTIPERPYYISALYLMGTPFDTDTFPPDMDVVEHVYNLYSNKDFVQNFAGNQHLPNHERMANLHVSINDLHTCEECLILEQGDAYDEEEELSTPTEHTTLNPCHGCLHTPLIGKWFLSLPELIQSSIGVRKVTGLQDGQVAFHHDRAPTYSPDQAPPALETSQTDQASLDMIEAQEDRTNEPS